MNLLQLIKFSTIDNAKPKSYNTSHKTTSPSPIQTNRFH